MGYLNLYNPMQPERFYKCDLTVIDHREMAKVGILCAHDAVGSRAPPERAAPLLARYRRAPDNRAGRATCGLAAPRVARRSSDRGARARRRWRGCPPFFLQVLVRLATIEPGENWVDERYRRKRSMDWIAGWVLPKEWEEEDDNNPDVGIRRYGLMEARYTSTGAGCRPDPLGRRELRQRFLCGSELLF